MLSGLDVIVLSFIYKQCLILGSAFGFGAFEGGVIYASLLTLLGFKVAENKKEVKRR